jgi:WhiB family transcriptional regulator, redox-sensing transcriptional regulator
MDLEWMRRAACHGQDPATFFPSDSLGVDAARRICHPCDVRRECLAYAMAEHLVHGVFGGCSERQRERMRRELEAVEGRAARAKGAVRAS